MHKVLITGHAESEAEALDFKVGEWVNGIGLMIRRTGDGKSIETGAGIWPTIDKAKQIAQETTERLFGSQHSIVWTEIQAASAKAQHK